MVDKLAFAVNRFNNADHSSRVFADESTLNSLAHPSYNANRLFKEARLNHVDVSQSTPAVHLDGIESAGKKLEHALYTEAVFGGLGAITGAATYGSLGYGMGKWAEIVTKPAPDATLSVAKSLARTLAKGGAWRGGIFGLATGAVIIGAYELLNNNQHER